jgi:hypothetical protein
MGILDRLKPQPRWKHADPIIRLEALRELDDTGELAVLAESDPDARIRRAAVGRVTEPAVLGRIARADTDEDTRDKAADRLVVLATRHARTGDGPDDQVDPLAAVREIADTRRLSAVARSEAPEAVRADALARLTDERALGSVARQAKFEPTAAAAVLRITGTAELLEVALHSEYRDVALAAFDRVVQSGADLAMLRTIEAKAGQKPVSRKARTMIQEIEAAEAARLAAIEDRRRREAALCDAVELVASMADAPAARAELARVSAAWTALSVEDPAAQDRFQRGVAQAEAAIARREREAEEAADLRRLRAEAIATRDALCARVETLDGDDALEQLVPIEEEWRSLLPLVGNGPEADRLAERFAQAVAACRKRHAMGTVLAETRASLSAVVEEAEGLLSVEDTNSTVASTRWNELTRRARGLTATLSEASRPAPDLEARLSAVAQVFAERAAARHAAEQAAAAAARDEMLGRLRRLAERAKRVAEADAITLREGDRLMRDLTAGFDAAGAAPASREIDEAIAELKTLQEQVAPRVRELREMDEWRRFANAQRQEQLIAMAEAIVTSLKADDEAGRPSDLPATARALRELHGKWQEVAEAPRQTAQRLWDRFRTATDFIRGRCESYFAKLREERAQAVDRKAALVTEAEALAASTDWANAAARFQQLQTEWQQLGPVSRDAGRELSTRFRAACNTFFARRREDLADRKKVWTDNLKKKEELCERAEALAASSDWDVTAAEMKRLQAEWKTVGPVRRNKSEAIWNRFRAATDQFFDRYHHRHEIALMNKLGEREGMVTGLEALVAAAPESAADLAAQVQQLRTTWNRAVPIPAPAMKLLADRWQTALTTLVSTHPEAFAGTDLDPTQVVRRMEKLVVRIEGLAGQMDQPAPGLSSAEQLAAKLRSALASNAMGGRAHEDTKWRSALDAVKDAQAAWQRLAPTSSPDARALETRFRDACRRVVDQARRQGAPPRRNERPTPVGV